MIKKIMKVKKTLKRIGKRKRKRKLLSQMMINKAPLKKLKKMNPNMSVKNQIMLMIKVNYSILYF